MMDRRIVIEDVRGVPMRVFADRPRSLAQLVGLVRARPPREYLVCGDRRVTDHDLLRDAERIAGSLRARGLEPGDRVAILAANSLEWAASFWGVVLAGGVVAALNGWWRGPEVLWSVEHCRPRFLIADSPRFARLAPVASELALAPMDGIFVIGAEHEAAEEFGRLLEPSSGVEPFIGDEDDPVAIFYTSGTTGRPKGAIATHRSWIAALQCLQGLAARDDAGPGADRVPDVTLATLPLFHVSGCQSTLVAGLVGGSRTVMLDGSFDAGRVLELVDRERVTRWSAVPTMVSRVCRHPDRAQFDLSSMRAISYGGSPAPPELPALVRDTFPNVRSLANAYGLTESGTIIAVNSGTDFEERPESAGRPFPLIEVRIGDGGEIQLRGPMIMPGYWDDPVSTAAILSPDGWLHTGDIGRLDDDGFLYVTDRAKDMIIRGGENVYPAEIELRLGEHPDVVEAAVVGVPDDDLGEIVKAVVRLAPASNASDEELAAFVGETLASFKVPARWERANEPLPRNATGKLLKNVLRGDGELRLEQLL